MSDIIIYIMAVFAVLGSIDKLLGNRFGLGKQFDEGICTCAPLALSMVGILVLAPVLAQVLEPVVVPVYEFFGADPAMFAGTILANDMGGAPLAQALARSEEAANFGGLIVSAMMGTTVVFIIPTALGIVEEADKQYVATGVLAGLVTIPVGSLVGGLLAGYSVGMIIRNLVPIILFAVVVALGLWRFQSAIIKGFTWFGKFVVAVVTLGLAVGILQALTDVVILPQAAPVGEGFAIVGEIAIVLAGAFPLVHVITKVFRKPLMKLGKWMGMNDVSAAGLVASLANSIPVFGILKYMDNRGKVVNMAFAVSATAVFGDHLGFTAGMNEEMIVPVVIGKLVGGVTAVLVALWITRSWGNSVGGFSTNSKMETERAVEGSAEKA